MKQNILIFALVFLLSISICLAQSAGVAEEKLTVKQAEPEYGNLTLLLWAQLGEDLNYSSWVLDQYVRKNITTTEALQSMTSVYTLTSRTQINFYQLQPPENYQQYHNYSINAIDNFRLYVWYISKFLETGNSNYALIARDKFNLSNEYTDKANEERVLNL